MAADNIQGLETLEAWKRSKDLAIRVYKEILPTLPVEGKWNLNHQICPQPRAFQPILLKGMDDSIIRKMFAFGILRGAH